MANSKSELISVLAQFNPWWDQKKIPDLPAWKRSIFNVVLHWIVSPPALRALLISGARQVGKTTLLLQLIEALIQAKVPPNNILYATFDHPLLQAAGIDAVIEAWREREPKSAGPEFLFIDEAQFIHHHGTWIKHQVDFHKNRHLIFTGSATPLIRAKQESGVGRWQTIQMATLSFYEFLKINGVELSNLSLPSSFRELFKWKPSQFHKLSSQIPELTGHFQEYLVRGGFPQTAQVDSLTQSQRLLREDIIDKVLKRDMTSFFGVRRIFELEQTFLYLCLHEGGLLDVTDLSRNLGVSKMTVQSFLELLEATHLIYRLPPYGYGKEILRGRYKIYLADPSISSAVMLKGKTLLDDPTSLGVVTETAVFKHLYAHNSAHNIRFSYWRGSREQEVDLVAETNGELIPFEVKYRSQEIKLKDVKGLSQFCQQKSPRFGYIITKSSRDFGLLKGESPIMQIPAPLFCYWMGEAESSQQFMI